MGPIITIKPEVTVSDVTFNEHEGIDFVTMKDIVSNHIVQAINNCVTVGIKRRVAYLDLTNSSSESDPDTNAVSIILDTPSFSAKVKKKHKMSSPFSSPLDTVSPVSYNSEHDTVALHSFFLNSEDIDITDSYSWNSTVAVACFQCSNLSLNQVCTFGSMPKTKISAKTTKTHATLWSEAVARQHASQRTYACTACDLVFIARGIYVYTCVLYMDSTVTPCQQRSRFLRVIQLFVRPQPTKWLRTSNLLDAEGAPHIPHR